MHHQSTSRPPRRTGTALRAVLGATITWIVTACVAYGYQPLSNPSPSALIGQTAKISFATDSLIMTLEGVTGRLVYGRVIEGRGPAAIELNDVRGARLEAFTSRGHTQNLVLDKVRANPTVLNGGDVVFTTISGDVLLRGVQVGTDGWVNGTVVANETVSRTGAPITGDNVVSTGLVRINLDDAQRIAIRDTNKAIGVTASTAFVVITVLVMIVKSVERWVWN